MTEPTSDSQAGDVATSAAPAVAPVTEPAGPAESPRDASQILITDWERRPMPPVRGNREKRFQVVIRQSALNQIHRHGRSTEDVEICGVLVGNVYHDAEGPWLHIERAIEGNNAAGRSTQVTFTAETWTHIQTVMERDYPTLRILGWYHTHPGFGIFLSDMDVFIQEHFFAEPWQTALVYDPKAEEEGTFIWKSGAPVVDPFLVEEDEEAERSTAIVRQAKNVQRGGVAGGDFAVLADRIVAIERRQKWILLFLALAIIIALAWPLVVSSYLPDLLKRGTQSPPPVNVPDYDDPTNRGKLGT